MVRGIDITTISNGFILENLEGIAIYCKDKEELKKEISISIDRIIK